jgi:hypothetical protein
VDFLLATVTVGSFRWSPTLHSGESSDNTARLSHVDIQLTVDQTTATSVLARLATTAASFAADWRYVQTFGALF